MYTQLKINRPYIALNSETYITLCTKELDTCKRIGYEYFCEELFVVKSKSRYSCARAIYFNLGAEIIKENCEFDFYFNKTNMKPAILDGGHRIILANWPSYEKVICLYNNNLPINIPSPYVLLNQSTLWNCDVEDESNFLLESLAACDNSNTDMDLVMYFTVNLAFVNYFDNLVEYLDVPILKNWTTEEQILPISLETFEINSSLLNASKILKDFVHQYQHKKQIFHIQEEHIDEERNIKF